MWTASAIYATTTDPSQAGSGKHLAQPPAHRGDQHGPADRCHPGHDDEHQRCQRSRHPQRRARQRRSGRVMISDEAPVRATGSAGKPLVNPALVGAVADVPGVAQSVALPGLNVQVGTGPQASQLTASVIAVEDAAAALRVPAMMAGFGDKTVVVAAETARGMAIADGDVLTLTVTKVGANGLETPRATQSSSLPSSRTCPAAPCSPPPCSRGWRAQRRPTRSGSGSPTSPGRHRGAQDRGRPLRDRCSDRRRREHGPCFLAHPRKVKGRAPTFCLVGPCPP